MLSQGSFCKILGFVIGHEITYNQLKWKKFNITMLYII
jgi:hypothetical protein